MGTLLHNCDCAYIPYSSRNVNSFSGDFSNSHKIGLIGFVGFVGFLEFVGLIGFVEFVEFIEFPEPVGSNTINTITQQLDERE